MSGSLHRTPCPKCKVPAPTLRIEARLVAKPMGTYSVAGSQQKLIATTVPFLMCDRCDLEIEGTVTEDGKYATFPHTWKEADA